MEDNYSMADLSHYMNGRSMFPGIPPPQDILQSHRSLTPAQHYEVVMAGRAGSDHIVHQGLQQEFQSDSTTSATNASVIIGGTGTSSGGFSGGGLDMDVGGLAGDGSTGRWPRQETLTLLEIRSKLDSRFKEANQKGPLWDEVSRIMSEEHGYNRSGKKCREKFENLYKYYKKTKEGKAGRQDGKHYRFFRQLEALYGGEATTNMASSAASEQHHLIGNCFHYNAATDNVSVKNPEHFQASKTSDSLSLSTTDFDETTSDDSNLNVAMENDSICQRKRKRKSSWKAKIKEFVDCQMRKLMDKQEDWLETMMKTIEQKEFERMLREEEWRKQEDARIEKEHQFWAKERAWIEARDTALMEALKKLTGKEFINPLKEKQNHENGIETTSSAREIASKMTSLGYDKTPLMCKEKWDSINDFVVKCRKKEKENMSSSGYFEGNDTICGLQVGGYGGTNDEAGGTRNAALDDDDDDHNASSTPNCNTVGQNINDGCFRYLMGDAENLWENMQRRE